MFGIERVRRFVAARTFTPEARLARKRLMGSTAATRGRAHTAGHEVIVSLTSYPKRYAHLHLTIRSLLTQNVMPDRVILWIAHSQFDKLPESIIKLRSDDFQIRACDDLRSYKKYIPALVQFREATIVTADDDTYYPPYWLERLLDLSQDNPQDIICWRANLAKRTANNELLPYRDWELDTNRTDSSFDSIIFPTGVGGVLYPPHSLNDEVTRVRTFQEICPHADDVWLFWMAKLEGRKHLRVGEKLPLIHWPGSQIDALWRSNLVESGNDGPIKAMEERYGTVPAC